MDRGRLEVLKRLTADKDSPRLLRIGVYRNNDIGDDMKKEFESLKQKDSRCVDSIGTKQGIQEILGRFAPPR